VSRGNQGNGWPRGVPQAPMRLGRRLPRTWLAWTASWHSRSQASLVAAKRGQNYPQPVADVYIGRVSSDNLRARWVSLPDGGEPELLLRSRGVLAGKGSVGIAAGLGMTARLGDQQNSGGFSGALLGATVIAALGGFPGRQRRHLSGRALPED
jgi:hypothetical protein